MKGGAKRRNRAKKAWRACARAARPNITRARNKMARQNMARNKMARQKHGAGMALPLPAILICAAGTCRLRGNRSFAMRRQVSAVWRRGGSRQNEGAAVGGDPPGAIGNRAWIRCCCGARFPNSSFAAQRISGATCRAISTAATTTASTSSPGTTARPRASAIRRSENDIYQYQGAEFLFIGIDELTHFTLGQWQFLTSRNRCPATRAARRAWPAPRIPATSATPG